MATSSDLPRADALLRPRPILLTGTLVSAGRRDPIRGIPVIARVRLFVAPDSDVEEDIDIAAGVTAVDGGFVLSVVPSLPDWVLTMIESEGGNAPIYADLDDELVRLDPVSADEPATYGVLLPTFDVDWRSVTSAVQARGLYRLNDLADAVCDPAVIPHVAVRLSALAELETAFLDPTGALSNVDTIPSWRTLTDDQLLIYAAQVSARAADEADVSNALSELNQRLSSFDNLAQVDWPIDLGKLRDGDVSGAVNAHAESFTLGGLSPRGVFGGPEPRVLYRNYLVDVWAGVAGQDWYWASQTPLTFAQAREQLTNRFHQDFTTTTVAGTSANELLIKIVKRILTEPEPTGYDKIPANLPHRGPGQSARDYLDALIAVTNVSAVELGLRYRLDLQQSDAAKTSPLQQNIDTLQGLFRDSFQSEPDPFHTAPDVRNDTVIPHWQRGRAPFFLEYEEWRTQNAVFYPENHLSMTRTLRPDELASQARSIPNTKPHYAWAQKVAALFDDLQKVIGWISSGEYQLALNLLNDTRRGAGLRIAERVTAGYQVAPPMKARKKLTITDKPSLLKFEQYLGFPSISGNPDPYPFPGDWTADRLTAAMVIYAGYFYWVWRSDILLATGHFTEAATSLEALVNAAVGTAAQDSAAGYFNYWGDGAAYLYTAGPLPYTYDRSDKVQKVNPLFTDTPYEPPVQESWMPTEGFPALLHRTDVKFLQLRLGNVLLEWADTLFRADDASSTARARELYKAVLWLHGENVPISPWWPQNHDGVILFPGGYHAVDRNPAVVSQITRARAGFDKIESGLNYFGLTDDMVPVQRYRTLKDQADRFAALAIAAERDFLTAMANLEQLSIEEMRNSNLLAKARAQQNIAQEQKEIAAYNVSVAKQQVADVQKQIDAKNAEIADHDGIFGQYSDFFSGLVKTFTGAPGFLTSGLGSAVKSEAGLGSAEGAGLLGLGAGASVLAGYGLFVYAGYSSMSGMASTYSSRDGELKRLKEIAMPLAVGNVAARQHEMSIATLQSMIADADIQLAQRLMAFNTQRLLNAEFWSSVAQVLRRVLRRYLDLGAWSAWLAERALAFEQDRPLRVVRMDYLVRSLQNVTGGELLQGDLAELEAARISGERALTPFAYSLSLLEEFPLAFAALKTRGSCTFSTTEAALRTFFPGTFGHRVRTVDVDVRLLAAGGRVRGTLTNHGVSLATIDESLHTRPLLRFPDAVAVSETHAAGPADPRLQDVLGPFEGSGLDTTWTLQLDRGASAGWWDAIADIVIEISGLARYSDAVRTAAQAPAQTHRFVMLAAGAFAAGALKALKAAGSGTVEFDLRTFPFAVGEKNRKVANVAVLLPGTKGAAVKAQLRVASASVNFTVTDGVAMSNGTPLRLPGSTMPDRPLNTAIGASVEQRWAIKIESSPGADLSGLIDVVLGVDYVADPV